MKTDQCMYFAALLRTLDRWWSKPQMWSEHFIIIPMGLSFHFVEMMAQRKAGMCPWCTWQGVRKWQWYAPGSRSLQEGATTAGGEEKETAQNSPQEKFGFDNILCMVLPDPESALVSSFLERTELQTCICLSIKTSPYPSHGMTKGNTQDLPSKKVRQNMVLQGYVPCSMLLSCNLKQIFDPSDTYNC